jgi:tetratricopeptide (TPR) repeat protein
MTYGRSFSQKLLQDGKYDEALAAAAQAIAAEPDNPEHFVDRAQALVLLEREIEAVPDFRRALELDEAAQILESDLVDDAFFSALLAAARAEAPRSLDAAVALLASYRTTLPAGRHVGDADTWTRRLKGELRVEWVKQRD